MPIGDFFYQKGKKMDIKAKLIDEEGFNRTLTRLAHEILERNKGAKNIALVGMRTRGEFIGSRIFEKIKEIDNSTPDFGVLDVTLYRDDFRTRLKQPQIGVTNITFDINEKNVILIDDVLYTGRTVRAALDALMDLGRPNTIQLCVMVDRGHRELPIKADFVGKNFPTSINEEVRVRIKETDGEDAIYLVNAPSKN
ncbi:MAG: bifunctional pyrimidine regulatory protein PyrR uracil phosphoribosyltransferase [Ignavibacteria bacterium]|nr:MAG: bifunctional pyrimidine regulatory protein PyrR uracil phosphoribosyltransferase [Ignavibacteria bacterium]KAF0159578.1 MAG: bifunctional pyrimidine regulatory protein PyrR uracil phosphoribosyltransferase [Ignavibacteria bacterium]